MDTYKLLVGSVCTPLEDLQSVRHADHQARHGLMTGLCAKGMRLLKAVPNKGTTFLSHKHYNDSPLLWKPECFQTSN